MRYLFITFFIVLFFLRSLFAAELLKNGDFETGDITGWKYWETYPWDGDGAPVELPAHIAIAVPGTIGTPVPHAISGSFAMAQQVDSGTARGGLYQEVKVVRNTPYILTGHMAFYGDDIGDVTIIGILDGTWSPSLAFTAVMRSYIGGNAHSSWVEFSLTVIPSKDIITIFTETRQDWAHGTTAGWYDNLSLQPVSEFTRFPKHAKNDLIQKDKGH